MLASLFNRSNKPKEARKQIRLKLRVIDVWSATKVGFFVAIAAGIAIVVGAWLIWSVLANSGVFSAVGGLLSSVLGEANAFNLEDEFSFDNVMSTALTLGAFESRNHDRAGRHLRSYLQPDLKAGWRHLPYLHK
jgi:hypothetical protein